MRATGLADSLTLGDIASVSDIDFRALKYKTRNDFIEAINPILVENREKEISVSTAGKLVVALA